MFLSQLPPAVAADCQDMPTEQVERLANEHRKAQIVAKHGDEVSDMLDLPANEFVQRWVSRQVGNR